MIKINAAQRLMAETKHEYVKRLKELGIKSMGQGMYGEVFQHPTMRNVVVKLLHSDDPGYMKYVEFCQGPGKGNPYCPKILQVVEAEDAFDISETYNVGLESLQLVFMEKLKPISTKRFHQFVDTLEWLMPHPEPLNYSEAWYFLSVQKTDAHLAKVAKFIYLESTHIDIDMHAGNVMQRGTQMVITDPFSS